MANTHQDLHITNWKTNEKKVIREITIGKMYFNTESVIIEYEEKNGIKVIMEIPKAFHTILID